MGADIHGFAEQKINGKWVKIEDVDLSADLTRAYTLFGFLGNVRNYSLAPIHHYPLRGLPEDSEYLNNIPEDDEWELDDGHSHTHVLLSELINFNYNIYFVDVRDILPPKTHYTMRNLNGIIQSYHNESVFTGLYYNTDKIVRLRDELNQEFFDLLDKLKTINEPKNIRLVYWFDN